MKYFLDISLVLLIALTVILCWKRGFIRSVFGVAKNLVAIIVTYMLGSTASAWISEHLVTHRVTDYVHDRLLSMFETGAETFDLTHILDNIPSWVEIFFQRGDLDADALSGQLGSLTAADASSLEALATSLAAPITKMVSDFLGYTLVFLVSLLALTLLAHLLYKVAELPVIRNIDHLLGLALGVLCAVLYASAYTLLLFAALSMLEGVRPDFAFHEAYEQTIIFQRIYNINLFRFLFGIG